MLCRFNIQRVAVTQRGAVNYEASLAFIYSRHVPHFYLPWQHLPVALCPRNQTKPPDTRPLLSIRYSNKRKKCIRFWTIPSAPFVCVSVHACISAHVVLEEEDSAKEAEEVGGEQREVYCGGAAHLHHDGHTAVQSVHAQPVGREQEPWEQTGKERATVKDADIGPLMGRRRCLVTLNSILN